MLRVAALISICLNSAQVLTMEKEWNERVLGYMYLCVRLHVQGPECTYQEYQGTCARTSACE